MSGWGISWRVHGEDRAKLVKRPFAATLRIVRMGDNEPEPEP